MSAVQRSFAGLFFGAAFLCACCAISGFLLQRALFTPGNSRDGVETVLTDGVLRQELIDKITQAGAPSLNVSVDSLTPTVKKTLDTKAGAHLVASVVGDISAHLIGDSSAPVVVSPDVIAQVVRDERANASAPLTLDVPRVGALAIAKDVIGWVVPLAAIGIVVFMVLCVLAHPERGALVRTSGLGMLIIAALVGLFGYVVPKYVPTLLTDSVWARVLPRVADDHVTITVITVVVFAAAGVLLFGLSTRIGSRRRWSTPISTYRYREERRWS
jgi:hypothetical protein